MEHNYVLWLTGVDAMLRSYGYRDCDETSDDVCREIVLLLKEQLRQKVGNAQVVETDYGLRFMLGDKRIAIVCSESYTAKQMSEDIHAQELTQVIFIRTGRHAKLRKRYVEVAARHGFSFVKLQLPEPVFISDGPMSHDSTLPNGVTSCLIKIDNSTHIHNGDNIVNSGNNNCNNNNGDDGKKNPKSWWKAILKKVCDFIFELIIAIAGGCGAISAIFGF